MSIKKKLLAVTTAVSILFLTTASTKKDKDYRKHFVINKGKITYSGGTIYLGSKYKIEHFWIK